MTGVAKNTIVKLLADIGTACAAYHDEHVRDLKTTQIQCDEIWSFVGMKEKNVPKEKQGQFGYGDVWTWTALDADSKLIIDWSLTGDRRKPAATEFLQGVADRLANRVQLTTDGLKSYLDAVYRVFGNDVDHATIVKIFANDAGGSGRYSPPVVTGVEKMVHCGTPNLAAVSTSFVERQNLTMRMSMRRFTRLPNGFSKKAENLAHNLALHFMHYNFCRVHQTLRVTPAMEAGLTGHVWEIEELVALLPK
jgi:IS1 family transposase